jgi:hypothetical protein
MLTNVDLIRLAKELKINLIGVCSKDELHLIKPRVGGYIINMQNSTDGVGSHWVSAILYQDDNAMKCLYFDSYGIAPLKEVEQYVKKINDDFKIAYSTRQIQKLQTTECGYYCLNFLYNMQYNRKSDNMIKDYENYIIKFSNDLTKDLEILKNSFGNYNIDFYKKKCTIKKT